MKTIYEYLFNNNTISVNEECYDNIEINIVNRFYKSKYIIINYKDGRRKILPKHNIGKLLYNNHLFLLERDDNLAQSLFT